MTKSLSLIASMITSIRSLPIPESQVETVSYMLNGASLSAAELQIGYDQLCQEMRKSAHEDGKFSATYASLGTIHEILATKAKDIGYILDERGLRHMEADNQLSLDSIDEREKNLDPAIIAAGHGNMNGANPNGVGKTL